MKKLLTLVVLLAFVYSGMAQSSSLAPQGAEWHFNVNTSPITYYRMAVEGDTIIQGHKCSIITRQFLGGNGDKQFVYEDNRVIYWYNQALQSFTTLYDFDAEEGDTWICEVDSCAIEIQVLSVEEVTWESHTYRVQHVVPTEENYGSFYYGREGRIIEGIGEVSGLFPFPWVYFYNLYCGDYTDYLRCYSVDGEILYHEGNYDCDYMPDSEPSFPEWYYEIENNDGSITYQHLECVGDTLFENGKRPKIIIRSNTHYDRDTITVTTHEYIYEEMGFVYWWNRDLQEFTTLYDLNANTGDEWEIKVGTESIMMHVDDVESIVYQNQVYRLMHVSDADDLFSGDIVCGIGHLTSFFPERLMRDTEGFCVNSLRCYWVDNELVFKYGEVDCDAIYGELHGVEENGPSTGSGAFEVYPNPAKGVLFVQSHAVHPNEEYRITNLTGQTMQQGTITAENQQINIEKLPAGMYFISVDGQTLKFVVK